jgi:hypothetical protein
MKASFVTHIPPASCGTNFRINNHLFHNILLAEIVRCIRSFLRRCRLSYAEIELAGLDPPLEATKEHLPGLFTVPCVHWITYNYFRVFLRSLEVQEEG